MKNLESGVVNDRSRFFCAHADFIARPGFFPRTGFFERTPAHIALFSTIKRELAGVSRLPHRGPLGLESSHLWVAD